MVIKERKINYCWNKKYNQKYEFPKNGNKQNIKNK